MRRGWTLVELVLVLAVAGLVMAVALPPMAAWRDRWLVRRARDDAAVLFAAARWRAQGVGRSVTVTIDAARGAVLATHDTWRLVRELDAAYGITLRANRSTLVYRPDGLTSGAANVTLVVARGAAAESLRVSRLGRVR